MSFTLRASRTVLTRVAVVAKPQVRTFIVPTAPRSADLVQDLYLRELKAYKPAPVKANDHEGVVRPWNTPAAPKVPDLGEASLSQDISTYQSQAVETETGVPDASASAETAESAKKLDDWFDEEAAFAEEKPHH